MRAVAVLAIAAALSLVGAAPAAAKAMPARDWSKTVAATPEGGFRMGNPAAKVKLIEYGSLACPHCRHFEETGYKPLVAKYVRTGRVSYEFRNLLLNTPDISISLLAHCAGPAKFFPMSAEAFAAQSQWQNKLTSLSDGEKSEIEKLSNTDQIVRFADLAEFPQIAARFGLTAAQSHQCLTDPRGLQRLLDVTEKAGDMGINRTPTFLINGKVVDGALWEDLEPLLKKAGA